MRALWQSREQADFAADRLRKFAQPQRLMILSLLREGEKSVTEIDAATGIGHPALSDRQSRFITVWLMSQWRFAFAASRPSSMPRIRNRHC